MNKKYTIVLDLDQTLISAEPLDEKNFIETYNKKFSKFDNQNMDGIYLVFERPHLQDFLNYVFDNFNVIIWTAASKDYALFIIDKIILRNKKNRYIDYILFSYHCDWSIFCKNYSKHLSMLWEKYNIPNCSYKNTIILDDYKEDVHKCQNNNCIIAPPFNFKDKDSEKDNFLQELQPKLKLMLDRIENNDKDITNSINNFFSKYIKNDSSIDSSL